MPLDRQEVHHGKSYHWEERKNADGPIVVVVVVAGGRGGGGGALMRGKGWELLLLYIVPFDMPKTTHPPLLFGCSPPSNIPYWHWGVSTHHRHPSHPY